MGVSWYAVVLLAASVLGASITPENRSLEKFEKEREPVEVSTCGRVWITVHSPSVSVSGGGQILDALELNWDFSGCSDIPRQIGLFSARPTTWATAMEIRPINSVAGFLVTNVPLGVSTLPGGWLTGPGQRGPSCLWPWVAAGNNNIEAFNCLKIQPTWMQDNAQSALELNSVLETNVPLGVSTLPGGWLTGPGQRGPSCLWPWVAAGNNNVEAFNCLKIQPTWMQDNAAVINRLRIGELALPGTHNAGAWRFNTEVSNLERDSFVLCQDRSVWAQLVHGIRYLDFRIAYYDFYPNEDNRYWLNHNLIRVRPLVPLLREIRAFMDATQEVVFLDAHHFPVGFYEQDGRPIRSVHEGLLDIIQRELGPHLADAREFGTAPGTRGPTLQTLLNADKRLVFSYVDNSVVTSNSWLWPILPHLWANTNNPNSLFEFLDQAIDLSPRPNARSPMHSAMAQTTPTVLDILFLRGSLRQNADAVNRNVTARLGTRWRANANIISSDFFLGNDVIDASIAISVERASHL